MIGDLNSRANCLNIEQRRNCAGKKLDEFLNMNDDFCCVNDGCFTFERPHCNPGALDACLITTNLSQYFMDF